MATGESGPERPRAPPDCTEERGMNMKNASRILSLALALTLPLLAGAGYRPVLREAEQPQPEAQTSWRLAQVDSVLGGQAYCSIDLVYEGNETYPSQVKESYYSGYGYRYEFQYDGGGRVTEKREYQLFNDMTEEYLTWSTRYEYDGDGNLVLEAGNDYETRYSYADGRLVSAHTDGKASEAGMGEDYTVDESYVYDESGRLTSKEASFVAPSYSYAATTEYSYDGNGMLAGERRSSDGQTQSERTYTYDGCYRFNLDHYADGSVGCSIELLDPAGHVLASFGVNGDPECTYEGDRLVSAFCGDSRLDFIYEQRLADETSQAEDGAWKQAYLDYVLNDRQLQGSDLQEMATYDLLYISDDDVPELWICYGTYAAGGVFCYYDGTQVVDRSTSYYLEYTERGNTVCFMGGHMGVYNETYARFEDGVLTEAGSGNYGGQFGVPLDGDTDETPVNEYFWDDAPVTREEYFAKRDELLPPAQRRAPGYAYDYDAIVAYLSRT